MSLALSLFCKIVLALWGSLLWNSRLPCWPRSTDSACQCRRCGFDPWIGKIPWKRKWQLTPVFLPGESHGQRSLAGYSPRAHKESTTIEPLSTHTHLNSVQSHRRFVPQAPRAPTAHVGAPTTQYDQERNAAGQVHTF